MTTSGQAESLRQELEHLMDEDAFEQALQQLKAFLSEIDSPLRDAVGQQMARYNRLRKDEANTPRIGRYTPFLNHCTELRFMSAIMGGYVFRHSLWQEHFIAQLL